jgi:hypothetical protein
MQDEKNWGLDEDLSQAGMFEMTQLSGPRRLRAHHEYESFHHGKYQ